MWGHSVQILIISVQGQNEKKVNTVDRIGLAYFQPKQSNKHSYVKYYQKLFLLDEEACNTRCNGPAFKIQNKTEWGWCQNDTTHRLYH